MTLIEALGLHGRECVAIVGGGGKTTLMYCLAAEAVATGRRVVVGGTTRFTPPRSGAMPPLTLLAPGTDIAAALSAALAAAPSATLTTGRGDKGRWLPLGLEQAAIVAAHAEVDLSVFEADGSRNRPFKAPGDGEPAIPTAATLVVAVAGLDVVGHPLTEEWVHRPERVAELTGLRPGEPIAAAAVATVLWHERGGRKGVPASARWLPVLNKAEDERRGAGEAVARALLSLGAEAVLLTRLGGEDPVVAMRRRGEWSGSC